MKWLLDGNKAGDSLFLHYSGHGGQIPSVAPSQHGIHEFIAPMDFQTKGPLTDATLFHLLIKPLALKAQLVCLLDCCHGGTVVDLPFLYTATDNALQQLRTGADTITGRNPHFSIEIAQYLAAQP